MRPALALALALLCAASSCSWRAAEFAMSGSEQTLRERPHGAPPNSPGAPPILVLALDGVSRDLLYQMLRRGELPNMAALLGGDKFSHAYFDDSFLSTLPSTTMAAWVSAMTGVSPAEDGVTGNEYFIRESREFACPAPVSFIDAEPTLAIYTQRYLDRLTQAPTVYERMRAREPNILIWVMMNHLFRGADWLLLAHTPSLVRLYADYIADKIGRRDHRRSPNLYATIDRAAFKVLIDRLASGPLPDVATLYVSGTDLYAHVAWEGPDEARRTYLKKVVEPELGRLVQRLRDRGRLDALWVMVVADHGHTPVMHDKVHALGSHPRHGPPEVLRLAGFRVRPFRHRVAADNPFSAVLAYGGPMAYVYVADRSTCPEPRDVSLNVPPRYEEDVLAAAESYYRANRDGTYAPLMKGTLDMILVRRPRPVGEIDLPFEVYVGDGNTMPIEDYLREHPHPTYIAFPERMHDLAVGLHGERAGDLILLAHDGDVDRRESRFYFSRPYRSWHGSPSRADSEIPLIVAHHGRRAEDIGALVRPVLGDRPYMQRLTDLLLAVRSGAFGR